MNDWQVKATAEFITIEGAIYSNREEAEAHAKQMVGHYLKPRWANNNIKIDRAWVEPIYV